MSPHEDELRPLSEQGLDLDDQAALGPYDLEGMRAAIDAQVGGGGGGGGLSAAGAGGVVAAAAVVLLLGGAALIGLRGASVEPAVVAVRAAPPQTARVVPLEPAALAVAAPRSAEPPTEAAQPPSRQAVAAPASAPLPPPTAPSEGVADGDAVPEPESVPTPPAPVEAPGVAEDDGSQGPATGDLAAQNAAFAVGEAALRGGDPVAAAEAFEAYLARWPNGVFRDDALLSILDLTLRAERWRDAEVLAERLEGLSTLSARHPEIRKARAEALVHQGRCDLALRLAESLERAEGNAIKRSCR